MSTVTTGAGTGRDPAGSDGWRWRLAWLEDQNAALRDEQQRLAAEREQLQAENERLRAERERLQVANERLRAEVEALRRAAKRQAAPFSKGDPTPSPKRPGRRPGAAYGTRAYLQPPEHVDQVVEVGDRVPDGPPDTTWFVVEHVDPPHLLVLHSTTHVPVAWWARLGASIDWAWTFTLADTGDGGTRLLLRVRGQARPWWLTVDAEDQQGRVSRRDLLGVCCTSTAELHERVCAPFRPAPHSSTVGNAQPASP
jgi:hypothetical protein